MDEKKEREILSPPESVVEDMISRLAPMLQSGLNVLTSQNLEMTKDFRLGIVCQLYCATGRLLKSICIDEEDAQKYYKAMTEAMLDSALGNELLTNDQRSEVRDALNGRPNATDN